MATTGANETGRMPQNSSGPRGLGILGYLYQKNPFYLLSVCFVFHGTAVWFQNQSTLHNPWALVGLIAGYILVLSAAAFVFVRFGNVWDDARSIFLIVLMLFVVLSLCCDDVLIHHPQIGKPLLVAGLLFSSCVSEWLMLGLRIRLPLLFRLPFHLMLGLQFLYPLCLVPAGIDSTYDAALVSWRIFQFSPAVALVLLTLLPAVRRGPNYVRNNGTPWLWPWFPWVALGTVAAGLGVRAYTISLSFDPALTVGFNEAMELPTAFGGYFLVPMLLAVGLLLLETGIVTGNRRAVRAAIVVPFLCLLLAIPDSAPNSQYARFLEMFAARYGSPVWLTAWGMVGYLAYALVRGVRGAERAFVIAVLILSVTNPQTFGVETLASPQWLPLLLIAVIEVGWGLWKADSRRTLLGFVCGIASLHSAAWVDWPSEVRELVAFHLIGAATIVIGTVFSDPFSRLLRGAGGLMLVAAGLIALAFPPDVIASMPGGSAPAYALVLIVVAFLYAWRFSSLLYLMSGFAVLAMAVGSLGWHAYLILKRSPEWRGADSFLLALACLLVALVISAFKGGLAQRLLALARR